MSQALRKPGRGHQKSNTAGDSINQLREKVGLCTKPEVTTGGRVEIYYSQRMGHPRIETLKKEEPSGTTYQSKIVKE